MFCLVLECEFLDLVVVFVVPLCQDQLKTFDVYCVPDIMHFSIFSSFLKGNQRAKEAWLWLV